jgi:hypothetical protein
MFNDPTPRSAEHTHEARCLAAAVIAAVENLRDKDGQTPTGFALAMQDNPLYIARGYLADGLMMCTCGPCPFACCADRAEVSA